MSEAPNRRHRVAGAVIFVAVVVGLVYAAILGNAPDPAWQQAAAPGDRVTPQADGTEAAGPAGAPQLPAPDFDLARVAPDGAAIVAGTAAPGAEVTIYAGSEPLATVKADAAGDFVAMFEVEPSDAPRALTLEARIGDAAAASDEVVMLLPAAPPTPGTDAAAAAAGSAATGSALPPEEPAVAATAIVGDEGVEATVAGAAPADGVTLASISYGEGGDDVTLSGRAPAGALLRAYVDDRLAEEVRADDAGRWRMDLGDVAEGLYRLRIDEVGADGRVSSRVETPFQRDYPQAPLPRPARPGEPGAGSITVQPGNSLWTLAREHYGSGVLYTQIFTANQDLIRDPDLIYPGQIFAVPPAAAD